MDESIPEDIPENVGKSTIRINQYIATFIACIISFSQGSFMGWTSPVLPLLQSQDTPAAFPPIGDEEASWIGSLSNFSSIFVIPLCSYCVDKLGRKYTGYIFGVPFIVSWVLTLCADSVTMLYVARGIGGLSAGGTGIVIPTYINDVAEDDIRGLLGACYSVAQCLGMLYSYVVGSYIAYKWYNISCLVQPVVYLVAFFWVPESPLFLMTKGKEQEAKKSLAWLRDGNDTTKDFQRIKMRSEVFLSNRQNKMSLSKIMNRGTYRALLICVGLMANFQLSGFSSVTTYTVNIFQSSGSLLSPNVATIIVGAILAAGTVLSSVVIEWSGRKLLLLSGNIISAVCLLALGTFFYLKNIGSNIDSIQWLPITCMSIFILCSGLALVPIPFVFTTELTSPQARGIVQSITVIFLSAAVFVTTKTFTNISNLIGIYGCFWFYGSSCIVCFIVIYFTVPETKNRSSEDIVAQLDSNQYIRSIISSKESHGVECVN